MAGYEVFGLSRSSFMTVSAIAKVVLHVHGLDKTTGQCFSVIYSEQAGSLSAVEASPEESPYDAFYIHLTSSFISLAYKQSTDNLKTGLC